MPLSDRTVAVLATDGFEQSELVDPVKALRAAGATVLIVSPRKKPIRAWKDKDWGDEVSVDLALDAALKNVDAYDALVLPGGVMNPDQLRMNEAAVRFTRAFFDAGKPVAAICHGPQILIECDVLQGRRLTSYPSIKTDLINAGAAWTDEECVVDQGLVTSRTPKDLPAFIARMKEEIAEGVHQGQKTR